MPPSPPPRVWRVVLGFVLAPLTPGFVIVPLTSLYLDDRHGLIELLQVIAGWTMLASFFAVPAALIVGVPMHLLFRRRGWVGWHHYAIGGAVTGSVAGLFVAHALFLATGAISGLLAALTLWLCAYGRDRAFWYAGIGIGGFVILLLAAALPTGA